MTTLPPDQEARLRELEAKATPGPWGVAERVRNFVDVLSDHGAIASFARWRDGLPGSADECMSNAELAVASRNALHALLSALDELRLRNAALVAGLRELVAQWSAGANLVRALGQNEDAEGRAFMEQLDECAGRVSALLAEHEEATAHGDLDGDVDEALPGWPVCESGPHEEAT